MDKREAILRELNMYPLWARRDRPASVVADAPVHVLAADEMSVPLATDVLATIAPNPNPSQPPLVRGGAGEQVDFPSDRRGLRGVGGLNWSALKQRVRDCTACQLRAGCTQTVFGVGDEKAEWLFVGEWPGADEDALGEPFVGQAGKLLDNMLAAIQLKRGKNVYIANIVKCRPPDNRNPAADEIAQCLPYLERQIALIQPKLIVALGKVASNALLGRDATLASLRGTAHDFHGIPLIVTYHPAYLLRSPSEKAKAWQDLCLATDMMQKL